MPLSRSSQRIRFLYLTHHTHSDLHTLAPRIQIIFALIERAQFSRNESIYLGGAASKRIFGDAGSGRVDPAFQGSFMDLMLLETERLHSLVRRYQSPSEHPFSEGLPEPVLPPIDHPAVLQPNRININDKIKSVYIHNLVPGLCGNETDDEQYGSSAVCDIAALQALSSRIHYGKFVAEAKFQANLERYGVVCVVWCCTVLYC